MGYIYFNRMNLATRATIPDKQKGLNHGQDLMNQLFELQSDLSRQLLEKTQANSSEFIERLGCLFIASASNFQSWEIFGTGN